MKKTLLIGLVTVGLFWVTGCEQKSPQEKAKDSAVEMAKDAVEAAKDSAKKTEEAVKKAMKCQAGKCASGKCNQGQ
ncbi:MAG: hypothetical protein L3J47_08540 [Sulfurovum sp.]|nr:hypothetical protein [Sulfurovum sp.]